MEKKIAIITGASSGIGLATAKLFVQNGWTVYCFSRRSPDDSRIKHISTDITDEAAVKAAVLNVFQNEGQIDLLINNAGFGISGAIEFTATDAAKKQLDVNFFGGINCTKAVLGYMRKVGRGRIINISSVAALISIPFQAFYSVSKAAVNAATMALANEVRKFNIDVCAVMPGDAKSNFTGSREKSDAGAEVYGSTMTDSLQTMEKDEQNGMSSEYVAEKIYGISCKRRLKPLYTIGAKYKFFLFLFKILPAGTANKIVSMIYAKP